MNLGNEEAEINVANDLEETAVRTVSLVHGRERVFYASLPCDTETSKGSGTGTEDAKHRLVSILWDRLAATGSSLWTANLSSDRTALPIHLIADRLGKPHLMLGSLQGPAISFSEGGGRVWAALCADESDVGIDAAEAAEFGGVYPFHRVFNAEELEYALAAADGDLKNASALLWSIKEAVVKALGCAFNLADPLQVHVYPSMIGADGNSDYEEPFDGFAFSVRLSGKALARFPMNAGQFLCVRSFPLASMWLSVAVLNRRVDTDEIEHIHCAHYGPVGLPTGQRGEME